MPHAPGSRDTLTKRAAPCSLRRDPRHPHRRCREGHQQGLVRTALARGNGSWEVCWAWRFKGADPTSFIKRAQRTLMRAVPRTPEDRRTFAPLAFPSHLPSPCHAPGPCSSGPELPPPGASAPVVAQDQRFFLQPSSTPRVLQSSSFLQRKLTSSVLGHRWAPASKGTEEAFRGKPAVGVPVGCLLPTALHCPAMLRAMAAMGRSLHCPAQPHGAPSPSTALSGYPPMGEAVMFRYLNELEWLFPKRISLGYVKTKRNFKGPQSAVSEQHSRGQSPWFISGGLGDVLPELGWVPGTGTGRHVAGSAGCCRGRKAGAAAEGTHPAPVPCLGPTLLTTCPSGTLWLQHGCLALQRAVGHQDRNPSPWAA